MGTTNRLLIQFGDGQDPEEFVHNCSINTNQEFTIEATTTDGTDPNCEDPYAPNWVTRNVDTLSAGITGAGTTDLLSYAVLRERMLAGESFPVRVLIDEPLVKGGGYYTGKYVMTTLGTAKEGKGNVSSNLSLASNGEVEWVDAAPPPAG
jgi:hypothetical protein